MKIPVFGGTVFLERQVVEAALASGHELTLFNRGQHDPAWFPEVQSREVIVATMAARQADVVLTW